MFKGRLSVISLLLLHFLLMGSIKASLFELFDSSGIDSEEFDFIREQDENLFDGESVLNPDPNFIDAETDLNQMLDEQPDRIEEFGEENFLNPDPSFINTETDLQPDRIEEGEDLEANGNFDDFLCINDPSCLRSATFCVFEGCCQSKICDENNNCVAPPSDCSWFQQKNSIVEMDDQSCLNGPNCLKNGNERTPDGCSGSKECNQEQGAAIDLHDYAQVNGEDDDYAIAQLEDEACFNDPNCKRSVTYCFSQGCCASKQCDEKGNCKVTKPNCQAPKEEPDTTDMYDYGYFSKDSENDESSTTDDTPTDEEDDEECFHDTNCHRNVKYCFEEGCCAFKQCKEDGECVVAMPDCSTPINLEFKSTSKKEKSDGKEKFEFRISKRYHTSSKHVFVHHLKNE